MRTLFFAFALCFSLLTFARPEVEAVPIDYIQDIKPIFESRCVQCHACYNSPCQLNFSSEDGVRRGMISKYDIGNTLRVKSYHPSRLGVDATTTAQWHNGTWKKEISRGKSRSTGQSNRYSEIAKNKKGGYFFPVIPLRSDVSNLSASTSPDKNYIIRLIKERQSNESPILDHEYFADLQAEKSRVCPQTNNDLSKHIQARQDIGSSAGMPYGLPPLSDKQVSSLEAWIVQGAPMPAEGTMLPKIASQVSKDKATIKIIEEFFNKKYLGDDLETAKRQLVSRYIYEHLFLSHLYFSEAAKNPQFYKIVRKDNKCSNKRANVLATLRPWEDTNPIPGLASNIYYCIVPLESTVTHKDHITYMVNEDRVLRWEHLFFRSQSWELTYNFQADQRARIDKINSLDEVKGTSKREVPSQVKATLNPVGPRDDAHGSNPFIVFKDIPVAARYQFLLDDSKHFVRTFIRGPVCKGNTATNSIDEQFHVLFLKPEKDPMVINPRVNGKAFVDLSAPLLDMPASMGSEGNILKSRATIDFARGIRNQRNEYRKVRQKAYEQTNPVGYKVTDLWDGQSENEFQTPNVNTNLTVFRNYNSASVVQGLVGPVSKTIFVLDYSIFERLYYLLVSGYDVFGDVNHQVLTRLYMSYLRMESEELFLNFLPSKVRRPMRSYWYTPGSGVTEDKFKDKIETFYPLFGENKESGEAYFENQFGVALVNESALLKNGVDSIPQLASDIFEERKAVYAERTLSDVAGDANYWNLQYTLALYRQAFIDKTKVHLGASIGYTGIEHSFNNRYGSAAERPVNKSGYGNFANFENEFSKLAGRTAINSPWVAFMPSVSYLLVDNEDTGQSEIYTAVRQKEHFNVAWIGGEKGRRFNEQDNIILYKGILGSYPNMIFHFKLSDSGKFLKDLTALKGFYLEPTFADYNSFISDWGTPRSGKGSERFWPTYDKLLQVLKAKDPIEAGVLDLNRYGLDYLHVDQQGYFEAEEDQRCAQAGLKGFLDVVTSFVKTGEFAYTKCKIKKGINKLAQDLVDGYVKDHAKE